MMDLEHGYYYGWSIADSAATALGNDLARGFEIKSAKLSFKNIYNWIHEENDQLNSFLLSSPPPKPGGSETVPVVINGVTQGKTIYTYQKSITSTYTTSALSTKPQYYTPPAGCTLKSYTTVILSGRTYYKYTYTKTTTSTKTNTTGVAPSGFTLTGSQFKPDMVTLGNGIALSTNLWERSDQQNPTDIEWGVEEFKIGDINSDPMNPWHDPVGGYARGFDLIYDFDEESINKLFEFALDGSFGIGIDPDCHYYNSGIYLTVETAPVPEPSTIILLLTGVIGVGIIRRNSRQ